MLLLLLIAFVGAVAFFAASQDAGTLEQKKTRYDNTVLERAKQALIAFSAFNITAHSASRKPGELPCPDHDNNGTSGVADGIAGEKCLAYRGWLPWATLAAGELKDSSGARLWYGVSDAYQTANQSAIGPDTAGALTLDGSPVAAVIIAPGSLLRFQGGRPVDNWDADSHDTVYLDYWNADGADAGQPDEPAMSSYFTIPNNNPPSSPGDPDYEAPNDIVVGVTAREIMSVAKVRVLEYVHEVLTDFYSDKGYLPYAAEIDGACQEPPGGIEQGFLPHDSANSCAELVFYDWFKDPAGWHNRVYYIVSSKCVPGTVNCDGSGDYLTYDGENVRALLLLAGEELSGVQCAGGSPHDQNRQNGNDLGVCHYLEGLENTDGDAEFVAPDLSAGSNDIFMPLYVL